jgi:hypothetical protein
MSTTFLQASDLDSIEPQIQFFKKISLVRNKLYSPGIELSFKDPAERTKFIRLRIKWTDYVNDLLNAIARVLVDKLEENRTAFEIGIKKLESTIDGLTDTVMFLELLGNVLGVIAKVVVVAS